jgi:hypothetical protein
VLLSKESAFLPKRLIQMFLCRKERRYNNLVSRRPLFSLQLTISNILIPILLPNSERLSSYVKTEHITEIPNPGCYWIASEHIVRSQKTRNILKTVISYFSAENEINLQPLSFVQRFI